MKIEEWGLNCLTIMKIISQIKMFAYTLFR